MSINALAQEGGPGQTVRSSDLLVRMASAAVLLGIAVGAAILGGVAAGVVAGAFAFMVLREWVAITGGRNTHGVLFAGGVAIATLMAGFGMVMIAWAFAVAVAIVARIYARGIWLPAGVIYASALGVNLVAIRVAPELGFEALIFLLCVVWATDSGAFFAGRTIGGPKLAPRISPKKTWAGAVGGLVAALAAGTVVARLLDVPMTFGLLAVTCGISLFGQIGDLFESWVKRRFDVKDSGTIIPGHGGVMDRVDGLTFAAAAAVAIGSAHYGAGGLGRGILIW